MSKPDAVARFVNTYLVPAGTVGKAVILPGRADWMIREVLKQERARVRKIISLHCHHKGGMLQTGESKQWMNGYREACLDLLAALRKEPSR